MKLSVFATITACVLTETFVTAATSGGYPWGYKHNDPEMASPEQ
ncbi:hypothetical protein F442_00172 [Phytophthora nicotianae P10297]|uniref:Uncharacterized protein n=4 Tax=Phytophthora nicotianae TaxID=4792 RepID=V9G1F6_PHYNI|nr:hypothetical protein F443_00188 [Phytophthora nicotianae P1569]ETM56945.1 hypothetical protein L914_00168 [Phytophthora nicotianae]ETO86252.1 hypothetical protein F444_00186 [Phytophthora nicotianae P1976]ETP55273.1 hypothetical protein F442_00172 [Phytophthora nicotianae P10297]